MDQWPMAVMADRLISHSESLALQDGWMEAEPARSWQHRVTTPLKHTVRPGVTIGKTHAIIRAPITMPLWPS